MIWRAQDNIYRGVVELVGLHDFGGNEIAVAQPILINMQRQDRSDPIDSPSLTLEKPDAQRLLQALWNAGLRPDDNTDRSDEVTALKAHITFAEHVSAAALALVGAK